MLRRLLLLFLLAGALACAQTPDPTGDWQSTLDLGVMKLRLVMHFTRAADGTFAATLDSIDQGVNGLRFSTVAIEGSDVKLKLDRINASYSARIAADGQSMTGMWAQNGAMLPVVFKKGGEMPKAQSRPQDPVPPLPYEAKEVKVTNRAASLTLAGTLTVPPGQGPFPAVVLITGSGPQNRNEELFNHRPFLVLSDHLTRRGIAVLRVDDRGVGGSGGSNTNATSEGFAGDILACVEFLKTRPEVNAQRIGLAGHSEGGLIGPLVAIRSKDVAFLVLMAGPGQRGDRLLVSQLRAIGTSQGLNAAQLDRQLAIQQKIFDLIRGSDELDTVKKRARALFEEAAAPLSPQERAAIGLTESSIDIQLGRVVTPWFRYFLRYDPVPTLRQVKIPVLAINGDKDLQVDAAENLPLIASALEQAGNRDVTTRKLTGLNHLFQTCKACTMLEYATLQETFSPAALNLISDWIAAHTK